MGSWDEARAIATAKSLTRGEFCYNLSTEEWSNLFTKQRVSLCCLVFYLECDVFIHFVHLHHEVYLGARQLLYFQGKFWQLELLSVGESMRPIKSSAWHFQANIGAHWLSGISDLQGQNGLFTFSNHRARDCAAVVGHSALHVKLWKRYRQRTLPLVTVRTMRTIVVAMMVAFAMMTAAFG